MRSTRKLPPTPTCNRLLTHAIDIAKGNVDTYDMDDPGSGVPSHSSNRSWLSSSASLGSLPPLSRAQTPSPTKMSRADTSWTVQQPRRSVTPDTPSSIERCARVGRDSLDSDFLDVLSEIFIHVELVTVADFLIFKTFSDHS